MEPGPSGGYTYAMHPILFEVPGIGFPVRSFGLLVVAGFLVGAHVLSRLARRHADDPAAEQAAYAALPVWILVGILIGARLMYVVVEIARGSETGRAYLEDPLLVLAYWQGGLVMYGGTLGGILAGLWCARRHGLRLPHALDLGLTAGFLGLAIGRVGCLLVGDDYGRIVPERFASLPFPLTLRVPDPLPEGSLFGAENAGELLWATQVWMALGALGLFLVGLRMLARKRYAGQVALRLLLLYAVLRFSIEAFRGDEARGMWFDGTLSTSQIVSVVVGIGCAAALVRLRGRGAAAARTEEAR